MMNLKGSGVEYDALQLKVSDLYKKSPESRKAALCDFIKDAGAVELSVLKENGEELENAVCLMSLSLCTLCCEFDISLYDCIITAEKYLSLFKPKATL